MAPVVLDRHGIQQSSGRLFAVTRTWWSTSNPTE
jgi:hypothetical protein